MDEKWTVPDRLPAGTRVGLTEFEGQGRFLIVNPGAGPVEDATQEHALETVQALLGDLGDGFELGPRPLTETGLGDGRWPFLIRHGDHAHEVEIPGLPVEQVRWTGPESGSVLRFPRLYVDGASWVWRYAVNILREEAE